MPLSFSSISHGTVAFGFFNIDTDLLLLENSFFFATEFSATLVRMAGQERETDFETVLDGYVIEDRAAVGDLMAAIQGRAFTGFIGEVYRRFPFPSEPEAFRQKPEGRKHQAMIRELLVRHAAPRPLLIRAETEKREVSLGAVRFDQSGFQALIRYVWRGGYPRWKDDRMPGYVARMQESVVRSRYPLFKGMAAVPE
jgi:hypothetical protein